VPRPDFPKTLSEFQRRFATEDTCREYLARSRWPDGFRCRWCRREEAVVLPGRYLWRCKACGRDTSVTAGTVLHRTRRPLREWFWAAYLMTTHTPGMSALQLQRQLGIGRYETAWTMLQKLRRAMRRPQRERLREKVEVDETFVGHREGLRGGRHVGDRVLVVGAVEVPGPASGRIRLEVVSDSSADSVCGFVERNVDPDATVITDGWSGYSLLTDMGYRHRPRKQGSAKRAGVILPRIHKIFGNLKTWLSGTHHGVEAKHMPAYLDEFVFRFNRRRTPMAAFQSLLGLAGAHGPTTRNRLYGVESSG
jgi:transposase-like protein